MKIVFTTDTISRGGKERQLFILTRSLLDKGEKVCVISNFFSDENYLNEYGLNADLIKILQGRSLSGRFECFKKIVHSENPDLLVSWDFQTSLFALLLSKRHGFKFINASIQHGVRLFRLSHILRSIICFLSPYVIANSFTGLRANNLKPGKRKFVLYNGIGNKFINTLSSVAIENLRDQIIPGYAENPGIVYITVANLVPYKDYFTVLKTLNKLKDQKSFYYFIVGDGPMFKEVTGMIEKYELQGRVILTGEIEDVNKYLFISDIMIHSSRGEGISNSILEGMHAGLPVIATNVGGIPETVFPNSSMLFPYKDHEALYQCLLKSHELKASFDPQSKTYQAHLEKFSVANMVKNFERIIETVMEGRGKLNA